jgi:hypothetical protein
MDELIVETARSVDQQLIHLAVTMAGSPDNAAALLRSIRSEAGHPLAPTFLAEAGALLRARHHLTAALAA